MTDLEKLITDKQDQLRGRPRDWLDDFGDWRRRTDWASVALIVGAVLVIVGAVLVLP
ncbi:hypothetical protein KIP88_02980 [Bradyrhizobium sp. SRL28]|uniref:hypothetical protein n=1 Tax=Bradyrhizobium sp. SRL28 TaxID=2836178 RepID=UPI001BDEEBA7|nr:hypothetical protein [Bradyrhizobium sp. SRL28]MBT1509456.1 hypothetical protein [Bradyrhizobium sp. SRL28]